MNRAEAPLALKDLRINVGKPAVTFYSIIRLTVASCLQNAVVYYEL